MSDIVETIKMSELDLNTKSKDFRYIYTNGFGAQFNGNELMLIFGIKEDYSKVDNVMLEEARVIMSASSAKLLGLMISGLVSAAERTSGQLIPIDNTKLEKLNELIAQIPTSPTVSQPHSEQSQPDAPAS